MANRSEDYPEEVFALYNELRSDPTTNKFKIGSRIAEEFPALFAEYRPRSVCEAIRRQAQERGLDIVQSRSGGRPKLPPADTRWLDATPELVIPFCNKVIVLSDLHLPQHDPEYLERALQVIRAREIELVVFNGDLLDFGHKGHHGRRTRWAPSFEACISAAQDFITEVCKCPSVTKMVFLCGNHDDRVFRESDREFEFDAVLEHHVLKELPMPEYEITNRYYAIMEPKEPAPWPFVSQDQFPTYFSHQLNYSGTQLTVAKRVADVVLGNIVTGHEHHLAVGRHPNGITFVANAGTGQDPRSPAYKQARQSTFPNWAVGFVTLTYGVPETWAVSSPEEWWDQNLS